MLQFSTLKVVERRKQIEIEEQEIKRKEKELMATVRLPAEAEGFKVQTVAEGMRWVFWSLWQQTSVIRDKEALWDKVF